VSRAALSLDHVKDVQLLEPLFEFSGACAGCGETPYLKLLSQLFGDRAMIANATGCSSIYGGNLPTTPWTTNGAGRGPAWANSLFEDNAEFGLGMRLTLDKHAEMARELVVKLTSAIGAELANELLAASQTDEPGIYEQRTRVAKLKARLAAADSADARNLLSLADNLVKKSVWIMGGGLVLTLLAGALIIKLFTNRLRRLSLVVDRFQQSGFAELPPHLPSRSVHGDDIDHLTETFSQMADRIMAQMRELRHEDALRRRSPCGFVVCHFHRCGSAGAVWRAGRNRDG
jgi:hypothetical protein